jgi:hypothetical protein
LEKSAGLAAPARVSDRKALLDQRVLAHPPPAPQRQTIEGQLVREDLLAAEQLAIGVLDPARARILVGEIAHGLEDREPRHQPRRRRRRGFPR